MIRSRKRLDGSLGGASSVGVVGQSSSIILKLCIGIQILANVSWIETYVQGMQNLRFALRILAKSPIVSLVAILSLALGIGANTAIFSLFEQILLRCLPVTAPAELVNLTANGPRSGSNSTNNSGHIDSIFSYALFRDLEQKQTSFTGLAAHRSFGANLAYQGQSSGGSGYFVSGSSFPDLGIKLCCGQVVVVRRRQGSWRSSGGAIACLLERKVQPERSRPRQDDGHKWCCDDDRGGRA